MEALAMKPILILAGACVALAFLWSIPPFREYFSGWLPNPLDDFAERWLGAFLSAAVAVLFFLGVSKIGVSGPPDGRPPEICCGQPKSPPKPPNSSGPFLTGCVVTRDPSRKLAPVTTGKARIGQNESDLTPDGCFQVALPDSPQPDSLLEIESAHYLNRFLRLDDKTLAQRKPIELESKKRIIVLPARASDRNAVSADEIRQGLENQLAQDEIDLVSDPKQRDAVVDLLYNYQQNGALYDPKTLARVGNFFGASDGAFWSLKRGDGSFTIKCRLIDLTTANIEYTVDANFPNSMPLLGAAEATADMLLSKMARAGILDPKDTVDVDRKISVTGFAVNVPKTWTLWIAILPDGNDMFFPQRRLSAHGDQSFHAPDVYAGPDGILDKQIRFSIYTVLADPEYSQTIQAYIDNQVQSGLAMNSWNKTRCRLLGHIAVVRKQ
jgi:hypothetical protein